MAHIVFQGKVFTRRTAVTRKEQLWKSVANHSRALYDLAVSNNEGNGMAEYSRKENAIEVAKDLRKALRELGI